MEMSQFHFHSIALVSKVKSMDTHEILAIPIEVRFAADEEVVAGNTDLGATFTTRGGEDNIRVTTDNSIPAQWIKFNSNRVTSPDVRRNDMVMIYRLGNTEKYYWADYNSKNVKRLETVRYAWSADPDNPMKDDLSNAYFLEISTHNKTITLHTSQANGEPFGYDFQMNTGDGMVQLTDTAGNTVWMDSANTCIGMINAAGTWMHLDKKNINAYAPDSINIKAVNLIQFKCKDFKIDASNSVGIATKDYSLNASSSITLETATFKSTANSNLFNCPTTVFTGDVAAANISVGGGAKRGGGNCTVAGTMSADTITCNSFSAKQGHIDNFSHSGSPCC